MKIFGMQPMNIWEPYKYDSDVLVLILHWKLLKYTFYTWISDDSFENRHCNDVDSSAFSSTLFTFT